MFFSNSHLRWDLLSKCNRLHAKRGENAVAGWRPEEAWAHLQETANTLSSRVTGCIFLHFDRKWELEEKHCVP